MTAAEPIRIERKKLVRAPRARVWQALTNIEQFCKWFHVEAKGTFQPGARVEMTSTYEDHKGVRFYLIVEEIQTERKFSWRWHPGAPQTADLSREPMTLVEFFLEEVEGGTMVTVVESGFDRIAIERRAKAFEDNSRGWEIQLDSLAGYVPKAA